MVFFSFLRKHGKLYQVAEGRKVLTFVFRIFPLVRTCTPVWLCQKIVSNLRISSNLCNISKWPGWVAKLGSNNESVSYILALVTYLAHGINACCLWYICNVIAVKNVLHVYVLHFLVWNLNSCISRGKCLSCIMAEFLLVQQR